MNKFRVIFVAIRGNNCRHDRIKRDETALTSLWAVQKAAKHLDIHVKNYIVSTEKISSTFKRRARNEKS